ncbi:hypothetical protein [Roseibium marinum]|uniref:hypothetical protein n=1 Tax=Roseibium marinum TaxID=281252 RepID=UPI000CD31E13|nr:hypothetical protein [Roseibium marinum]
MGLGSWLSKKATEAQRREADNFLVSLKGADQLALDVVSAATMSYAAYFEAKGRDVYRMALWIEDKEQMMFPLEIGQMIKAQQKQKTTSSTPGLMVWLFSARALLEPQLRLSGRDIWSQLSKSSEESEVLASEMCVAMNLSHSPFDRHLVPIGLEQLQR